jgi:hypothetical protein
VLDAGRQRLSFRCEAIYVLLICGARLFRFANKFSESGARREGKSKRHKERKLVHGALPRFGQSRVTDALFDDNCVVSIPGQGW